MGMGESQSGSLRYGPEIKDGAVRRLSANAQDRQFEGWSFTLANGIFPRIRN